MLLHRDGLIELNYEVTSDILSVKWPDMSNSSFSEIEHSINKLVETLKHYDIKKLLIDGRGTNLEVADEDHRALAHRFAQELQETRLQKLARLASENKQLEKKSQEIGAKVQESIPLPFVIQTFSAEPDALRWLMASWANQLTLEQFLI